MILNLPFIGDQRKELKAGVWDFQKNLQAWGGVPAASSLGREQTHLQSPRPEAVHSQARMWGARGGCLRKTPGSRHQQTVDTAQGVSLGLGCGFIWILLKSKSSKPRGQVLKHRITGDSHLPP